MQKSDNKMGAGVAIALLAIMSWPPIRQLARGMPSESSGWLNLALALAMLLAAVLIPLRMSGGWLLTLVSSAAALAWLMEGAARYPVLLTNDDFELQLGEIIVVGAIALIEVFRLRHSGRSNLRDI